MSRSEWVPIICREESHKTAIRGWFSPLCDNMTPLTAQVLEDTKTGRQNKARAFMLEDGTGKHFLAVRQNTKAGYTLKLKPAR